MNAMLIENLDKAAASAGFAVDDLAEAYKRACDVADGARTPADNALIAILSDLSELARKLQTGIARVR